MKAITDLAAGTAAEHLVAADLLLKGYNAFLADQRSYLTWCSLWIAECVRILKPGGYFMAFTDWRQLPIMTDAVQAGGVFWRGIVAWDKGRGSRAPHKGYFRHQCEYVVWGTKGAAIQLEHDGPFDGCIQAVVKREADYAEISRNRLEAAEAEFYGVADLV